ncbi:MAG: hypothetical protein IJ049_02635 [Oscillospiraceae bacterium]|nr:hypothetical protein [Oscillospiraceae bacterium]MBR1845543.1 hypothetical protein [Oscillospiraceae bacterium]
MKVKSRYFLMEIREISGDVIDIRTRRPVLAAAPAALPPARSGGAKRQLMPTGKYLGLWLDVTASLAIVAVCAAFWMELMM